MNKAKAVVVGTDHFNTLGIIRSLGESGIEPTAVIFSKDTDKAWTLKSKYLNRKLSCVTSIEKVEGVLSEIGKEFKEKAFLIPSCDLAVKIIDDNNCLEKYYYSPRILTRTGKMFHCMDKTYSAEIALKAGFLVPETMCLYTNDVVQIDAARKRFAEKYPLIIKENSSVSEKDYIRIISTEKELIKAFKECGNGFVMLQQFVKKDEELGVQGVGFGDGTSYIPGVVHKIRTSIDSIGSTTYAEIENDITPELRSKCESFIREFQYSGIFDIEVLRKGKEYYFIECNFRNGAYGYRNL